MGILSTREWATVIWAFIFFVYAMVHRQITMTIYGQADRLVLDDYMIEMVCQYKIMAKSMY